MSIEEVYEEAIKTFPATTVDTDEATETFYRGIKIVRDEDGIRFYDTTRGGDTYAEFDSREYATMCVYGWREGLLRVKMNNYKHRLELLEARVRMSILAKHSSSHIASLKNRREELTSAYAEASRQLNLISHGDTKINL